MPSSNAEPPQAMLFRLALLVLLVGPGCETQAAPSSARPTASVAIAASKPPAATLEPCRLLTNDEASVFLEGSSNATPSEKLGHASACIWEAHDPLRGLQVLTSSPSQLGADPELVRFQSNTVNKRFAQIFEGKLLDGTGTPVKGLADGAIWVAESNQLWILKKDRALVAVSFHGQQLKPDLFERSQAVAKKVLERL